jgi:electron transport complex protein RnfB
MSLADAIDAVLPQTQCGKCGYPGCRPYAEAIVRGTADINHCPPGADESIEDIAALLGVSPKPVDPRFGKAQPSAVALIDEEHCIGCTLCIQACPVDAIVGAAKLMHTVIASACTGCELCVAPCPVDCIRMQATAKPERPARRAAADEARRRYEARARRLERARDEKEAASIAAQRAASAEKKKMDTIAKAVGRAKARLQGQERSVSPVDAER